MTKGSTVALIVWIMCRQPKKIYFPLRITDWTFPLPEEIQLLLFLQKVGFIQGRSSQSWFAGPQNGWGWTAQAGPSHRAGCTGPRPGSFWRCPRRTAHSLCVACATALPPAQWQSASWYLDRASCVCTGMYMYSLCPLHSFCFKCSFYSYCF